MRFADRLNSVILDLEICIQDAFDHDVRDDCLNLLFAAKNAAIDAIRTLDRTEHSVSPDAPTSPSGSDDPEMEV